MKLLFHSVLYDNCTKIRSFRTIDRKIPFFRFSDAYFWANAHDICQLESNMGSQKLNEVCKTPVRSAIPCSYSLLPLLLCSFHQNDESR